jgi:hypothetical protein
LTRPRNNFLATLLLAPLGLPLISGRAQDKAPVQRSPRGWLDPNVREEYKKWLREDVVYVISDQEGADFKKLTTDQFSPLSETWHYKNVEGLGQNVVLDFIDKCRCGEYSLTKGEIDSSPRIFDHMMDLR